MTTAAAIFVLLFCLLQRSAGQDELLSQFVTAEAQRAATGFTFVRCNPDTSSYTFNIANGFLVGRNFTIILACDSDDLTSISQEEVAPNNIGELLQIRPVRRLVQQSICILVLCARDPFKIVATPSLSDFIEEENINLNLPGDISNLDIQCPVDLDSILALHADSCGPIFLDDDDDDDENTCNCIGESDCRWWNTACHLGDNSWWRNPLFYLFLNLLVQSLVWIPAVIALTVGANNRTKGKKDIINTSNVMSTRGVTKVARAREEAARASGRETIARTTREGQEAISRTTLEAQEAVARAEEEARQLEQSAKELRSAAEEIAGKSEDVVAQQRTRLEDILQEGGQKMGGADMDLWPLEISMTEADNNSSVHEEILGQAEIFDRTVYGGLHNRATANNNTLEQGEEWSAPVINLRREEE